MYTTVPIMHHWHTEFYNLTPTADIYFTNSFIDGILHLPTSVTTGVQSYLWSRNAVLQVMLTWQRWSVSVMKGKAFQRGVVWQGDQQGMNEDCGTSTAAFWWWAQSRINHQERFMKNRRKFSYRTLNSKRPVDWTPVSADLLAAHVLSELQTADIMGL